MIGDIYSIGYKGISGIVIEEDKVILNDNEIIVSLSELKEVGAPLIGHVDISDCYSYSDIIDLMNKTVY